MKLLKIYLIVATVLLCLAIGAGVYVWLMVQKLDSTVSGVATPTTPVQNTDTADHTTATPPTVPQSLPTEPIVVPLSKLSPTQQEVVKQMGYTADTFTITPAMTACAADVLSPSRLAEIVAGATPTALESVKLLPCLKS